MERLITRDDLIDVWLKGKQRGAQFVLSKFNFKKSSRTKSAFNSSYNSSSNWWDIPYLQERWNRMISGQPNMAYEAFMMTTIFKNHSDLKLLSLGSGSCTNEIGLSQYKNITHITCVDLSDYRIENARKSALKKGIANMEFICEDINTLNLPTNHFDIVLFNSSLHHFNHVEDVLTKKVSNYLKPKGYLVINEFVGATRLQLPDYQIKTINEAISSIPKNYRKRFKSNLTKSRFSGSGLLRMIIADPSECIDSASIMPAIHRHFKTVIEKPYGGNITMFTLKDIAHNFVPLNTEKKAILDLLFKIEDDYLKKYPSDNIFGIYQLNR